MPRSASSNAPLRIRSAPVNAPFSWPNSSDSMSDSAMAEQLTGTNGPSRRPERAWSARATSSLPVPVSPRIVTAASEAPTRSTSSNTCRIAGSRETIPSNASARDGSCASRGSSDDLGVAELDRDAERQLGARDPRARDERAVRRAEVHEDPPRPRGSMRRWRDETNGSSSGASQVGSLPIDDARGGDRDRPLAAAGADPQPRRGRRRRLARRPARCVPPGARVSSAAAAAAVRNSARQVPSAISAPSESTASGTSAPGDARPAPGAVDEVAGVAAALDDRLHAREGRVGERHVAAGIAADRGPVVERHAQELLAVAEEGELGHGRGAYRTESGG